MSVHLPLRPMHHFPIGLLQGPLGQLVLGHEPISRAHIDLREEQHQPAGYVEPIFIVQVVLGVHEVLPLGLRLGGRGRFHMTELGVGVLEVLLLPLAVFAAKLDVGDNGVERDGLVVGAEGTGR